MAPKFDMSPDYWKKQNVIKGDNGMWSVDGRPFGDVRVVSRNEPPNLPGKTWLTLMITAPPGTA
jgi:hypothetical protein